MPTNWRPVSSGEMTIALVATSLVCVSSSVGIAVYVSSRLCEHRAGVIQTQTVNIEQRDQLHELIRQELFNDGMRSRMGSTSGRNSRPDSE